MKYLVSSMLIVTAMFNPCLVASEYKPVCISQIIQRCKEGGNHQSCNFLRTYIDRFYPAMCGHQGYLGDAYHGRTPSHISRAQEDTCKHISEALSDMEFASEMLEVRFTQNYFNDLNKP